MGDQVDCDIFDSISREVQESKWCVWNKYGHRPAKWHDSLEAAETEATRLARKCPGKTFIVFQKLVNIRVVQAALVESPPSPHRSHPNDR